MVQRKPNRIKNAVLGGVRDTASSFVTLPERMIDMASGQMQQEMKLGSYEPDFNPFGGINPETNTWWGKLIRGGVHFGTLAIPIVGWGGAAAKGTGVAAGVMRATVASPKWLVKGASVGLAQTLYPNILKMLTVYRY